MKILVWWLILFTALSAFATAPSMTTVTATLQDSSTQVWANATWTTTFLPPFGNPGTPNNNGNPVSSNQSGVADALGTFSVTLDDNLVVAPAGSKWKFVVCPNASVAACNELQIVITGATMNISTQLNAILTVPAVTGTPSIPRAYNDAEVSGTYGVLYVNVTDNSIRECQLLFCGGTGWVSITVATNNPVFTGTLTTGCVKYKLNSSDDVLMCPQPGSGHISLNLPTTGGVVPSFATSPIVLGATGEISCPTCGAASFPLFAPDSLAAAPQYSFAGDHGTGMRRDPVTFRLGWTVGGTETMSMNNITVEMVSLHVLGTITTDFPGGNVGIGGLLNVSGGSITVDGNPYEQTNGSGTPAYSLQGFEVANPGPASAGKQRGYFKAGFGWCTEDSGSVVYCTSNVAAANPSILAQTNTTCTLCPVAVANSLATVISKSVTFPSSGCPCRIFASYTLYFETGASGNDGTFVSESGDTNKFGWGGANTTGAVNSGSSYTIVGSGYSPVTYTNSSTKTFTVRARNSHSGNATALANVGSDITTNTDFVSNLNIVVYGSN